MERLESEHNGIQGGDWGATVYRYVATNYPDHIIGLHSNFVLAGDPGSGGPGFAASDDERTWQLVREACIQNERAYQQIQGTSPVALGYGLNDSPADLAPWIDEKIYGWSELPRGGNFAAQEKSQLLLDDARQFFRLLP